MKSSREIKIASRTSKLAMWQTFAVKTELEKLGWQCTIIPIETTGDVQLKQPIYSFGITGVFTKQLDTALINKQANIAVHSLKDVPTQLAENLSIAAVLPRGPVEDVILVKSEDLVKNASAKATVASSSLRRRAQWLSKYPNHTLVPIRGNVQTRLRKFEEDKNMGGVIFAKAGLHRLDLLPENAVTLDWMLPAPAQGIIGIACRQDDHEIVEVLKKINHRQTFIAGAVERQFLRTLLGGCSVPISALAKINADNKIELTGALHSFNGNESYTVNENIDLASWDNAGKQAADKLLAQKGAVELMEIIRNKNWNEEGTVNQES